MASWGISHFYIRKNRRLIIVWNEFYMSYTSMISHVISPWPRSKILRIFVRVPDLRWTRTSPSDAKWRWWIRSMQAGSSLFLFGWMVEVDCLPPKNRSRFYMILWIVEGFWYFCWEIQVVHSEDFGFVWYLHLQFLTPFACHFVAGCVGEDMIPAVFWWVLGMRPSRIPHQFDDLRAPRAGRHFKKSLMWHKSVIQLGDWRFHCANLDRSGGNGLYM